MAVLVEIIRDKGLLCMFHLERQNCTGGVLDSLATDGETRECEEIQLSQLFLR